MKGAAIAVGGDAERRVVLQRVMRTAFPRCRCEQLLTERLEREVERRPGNRAVGSHRHAFRLEPGLAEAIGSGTALRRLDVDRTVHGVELRERGQALLRKLHRGNRPDGRDEFVARDARRALLQRRNCVGNREHVLQGRMPSGPVADEHDVVVRVDETGNDRLALQIDAPDAARLRGHAVADRGEPAIANQHG